ncbi:22389_t:CDS:1, partial [Gigaspora rosea]
QRHNEEFKVEYANLLQQKEELNNRFLEFKRQKELQEQLFQNKESELKRCQDDFWRQIDENNKTRDDKVNNTVQVVEQVEAITSKMTRDNKVNDTVQVVTQVEAITNKKTKLRKLIYPPLEARPKNNTLVSSIIPQKRLQQSSQKSNVWDMDDDDLPSPFIKQ